MDETRWHICPRTGFTKPLLSCARCARYPCQALTSEERQWLEHSPFTDISPQSKLLPRRTRMYLFRHADGTITPCYEGFDPDSPDFARMENVEEVLLVSKVFAKEMRLTVKSKEERAAIRGRRKREDVPQAGGADEGEPEIPDGTGRSRKNKL